jgi:high-affinity nickel-transport protein
MVARRCTQSLVVGTGVSGGFLYVIAAFNLVILLGLLRAFHGLRGGDYDEAALHRQLDSRGGLNRL